MNRINIIILGITLLATSLFSQEVGFNDSVKLKNGKVLEKVKAVAIKDSLVVVDSSGAANVYSKKEVSEVVKNDKLTEADQVSKSISSQASGKIWTGYLGRKTWRDAVEYCAIIGARLPTGEELKCAYDSGFNKVMGKDGCMYWTAPDPLKEDDARAHTIGSICNISSDYLSSDRSSRTGRVVWSIIGDVRCIR
ncbi:MAG: hypothetical protein IPQ05_21350 [Leptospiraceae bacterium]|nr:hypothetical protein [Leptospiraceae bacterium]